MKGRYAEFAEGLLFTKRGDLMRHIQASHRDTNLRVTSGSQHSPAYSREPSRISSTVTYAGERSRSPLPRPMDPRQPRSEIHVVRSPRPILHISENPIQDIGT
ncbi:hypothetical protein SNE40_014407 [Patella caerulea]|uniref:Uncharacterized protein n=1 Tax=Patella caerulea TaxID=87958 RepID=A0AAN8JI51_PATCE